MNITGDGSVLFLLRWQYNLWPHALIASSHLAQLVHHLHIAGWHICCLATFVYTIINRETNNETSLIKLLTELSYNLFTSFLFTLSSHVLSGFICIIFNWLYCVLYCVFFCQFLKEHFLSLFFHSLVKLFIIVSSISFSSYFLIFFHMSFHTAEVRPIYRSFNLLLLPSHLDFFSYQQIGNYALIQTETNLFDNT